MTTIAYHKESNTIAYDSREASGNVILSDHVDKCKIVNDKMFFLCGCVQDFDDLLNLYFGKIKAAKGNEAYGYTVVNGAPYELYARADTGSLCTLPLEYSQACGSGKDFALAAMDFGKTAAEAVEYAKTRDPFTGGKVNVFSVDSLRG